MFIYFAFRLFFTTMNQTTCDLSLLHAASEPWTPPESTSDRILSSFKAATFLADREEAACRQRQVNGLFCRWQEFKLLFHSGELKGKGLLSIFASQVFPPYKNVRCFQIELHVCQWYSILSWWHKRPNSLSVLYSSLQVCHNCVRKKLELKNVFLICFQIFEDTYGYVAVAPRGL